MINVVVYSKPDCCLCDEVKAQLVKLQEKCCFDLREKNILEDPIALAQFHAEVPVVFINGKKQFKFHLDEKGFLKRIKHLSTATRSSKNAT